MSTFNLETAADAVKQSNKEKAFAILHSLETRDSVGPGFISDDRYVQHNHMIADNKPGFLGLQSWLPENNKVIILRAFEDGDYVFVHAGYDLGGPIVGMDIFRFENGKAVEHWDNLQMVPPAATFEGMTAGPVTAGDLDKTATNKSLVVTYATLILVENQENKLPDFINVSNYKEHQPAVSGLHYNHIHLVLGEGDFILVQSEGELDRKPVGLYDLFRVANDQIVEHWNTVEEIPARENWQNPNGKF
jgi:predicted SnoaL-like aldol condensation-catalyzing enzyme